MVKLSTVGLVLVVLGALVLVYQGFNYSRHEKSLTVGSTRITLDDNDASFFSSPPTIVGVSALVGGIGLMFAGAKKKS
jgi:hypothetical protein